MYENQKVSDTPRKMIERHHITRFMCVFCPVCLMAALFNPPSRASILMWFSSRSVQGVVTHDADPNNHNYISYEYTVGGKTYSGIGYGPNHADMRRGEVSTVYYFPAAPSESVLSGKEEQRGYAAFGLFAGLLMGTFAGFGDYWKGRKKLGQRPLQIAR